MLKSARLKTRVYPFEEEELKKSLPEIMFSTNDEIILHFQFRRSRDKITPTQKIIARTIGDDCIAKFSGPSNCPENFILFLVKKPWVATDYKAGIMFDFKVAPQNYHNICNYNVWIQDFRHW